MTKPTIEEIAAYFGPIESAPLSRFQKVVGQRLSDSWTQIPHVTHHDDVDVTTLEAYRKGLAPSPKISPVIFLAKALAAALAQFPNFNACLSEDGGTLIRRNYCNVGIAVDGPLGLLVPVLRDVDKKDIGTLSEELSAFIDRARSKGLPIDDMMGASMTITSLGGIGGTAFTPIINHPEVAILGVTRSRMVPVWDGSAFQPRLLMPLSLSYDHRVINGADAARFVRFIGERLDSPVDL
jgi:pyruvate dehydrogenase E2 component (dihydrolipoamide acetyltransferase)